MHEDRKFMKKALEQARLAYDNEEVPIGAVMVKDERIVAADHNRVNELHDPLAHAEKLLIEKMIQKGTKFFTEYTLYITAEPCLMCAGIIIWARFGRIVFGCYDPKAGAAGSVYNALLDKNFNHNPALKGGVLQEECAEILQDFFRKKRT